MAVGHKKLIGVGVLGSMVQPSSTIAAARLTASQNVWDLASLREVCTDSAKKVCVSTVSVCLPVCLCVAGRQLPGCLSALCRSYWISSSIMGDLLCWSIITLVSFLVCIRLFSLTVSVASRTGHVQRHCLSIDKQSTT